MIPHGLSIDRVECWPVLDANEISSDFCDTVAAETCSLDDRNDIGERLTCLSFKGLVRKGLPISARGELTRDEHSAPSLCRLHVVSKRSWSPFSIDCYN
jgi:hypothetical protein